MFFGSNVNKKICFWNLLTFSNFWTPWHYHDGCSEFQQHFFHISWFAQLMWIHSPLVSNFFLAAAKTVHIVEIKLSWVNTKTPKKFWASFSDILLIRFLYLLLVKDLVTLILMSSGMPRLSKIVSKFPTMQWLHDTEWSWSRTYSYIDIGILSHFGLDMYCEFPI